MTALDEEQDMEAVIDGLLQTCDCAACERLRRVERRRDLVPRYTSALERVLGRPSLTGGGQ